MKVMHTPAARHETHVNHADELLKPAGRQQWARAQQVVGTIAFVRVPFFFGDELRHGLEAADSSRRETARVRLLPRVRVPAERRRKFA